MHIPAGNKVPHDNESLTFVKNDDKVRIALELWYGSDGVISSSTVNMLSEFSSSYIGDDDKFMQFIYSIGENPTFPSGNTRRIMGISFCGFCELCVKLRSDGRRERRIGPKIHF